MIRVKTFTSQLRIFHTKQELDDLDRAVNEFIASRGVREVISVSDAVTAGTGGEAIGIIRSVAYVDPEAGARERYVRKMESLLEQWGGEIEKLRGKADKLGAEARAKLQGQIDDLKVRQEAAGKTLHELRISGGEAWDDLKAGADAALGELKRGVEGAVRKLRKR